MNIFSQLYCRTVQGVFKLALPFLPYRDPQVLHTVKEIPDHISNKDKVFIVVDPFLYSISASKDLEVSLKKKGIEYYIFAKSKANPTASLVEEAFKEYIENKCNVIVALGGGSPIDLAKALGAKVVHPNKPIAKFKGLLKVRKKIPTLFAIPTTAGTGSETTLASVIIDDETREKYAINDFSLIPSYAVLDPELLATLPKQIIANTGMDALTHALEAYLGIGGNKSTRKDALEAMDLIFNNLENAYNTNCYDCRKNMLLASFKAGKAFSKAYVGYVHAIAHALGGQYDIAHGLANAVILPIMLREYDKSIYKKMKKIAIYLGFATKESTPKDCFELIVSKIEKMNKEMLIPTKLPMKEEDIPMLAKRASHEANPLYPVPKLFSKNELADIFRKIKE